MRPRIGITTSTLDDESGGGTEISAVNLAYVRSVYHAGGLPVLLPTLPLADDAEAEAVLASLDGLLLSGGGDIDPFYFHESPHPATSLVYPDRDHFEFALLRAALRRDLPLLGICRGLQVIVVGTGGDLWQDIPTQCPTQLCHRQTTPRHETSHTVAVAGDSKLAPILWPDNAETGLLAVNSFHHQAARTCDTLVTPVAKSPDGIIEAVSIQGATFALGVQWHPESMAHTDPQQARLFRALVEAARGK